METLTRGASSLHGLPGRRLRAAWASVVEEFLDPRPDSEEERLRDVLARTSGLSRIGLDAALHYVLRGVATRGALDLLSREPERRFDRPAVAVLSSNLPGLAVQSLLPALALRRPILLKSPSAEPFFAPAFAAALTRKEPALQQAVAAVSWPGGSEELESQIFDRAGRVVAYGDASTAESLRARLGDRLVMHGPKISVAILGAEDLETGSGAAAAGVARDIALFDQRGCLSVQGVLILGGDSSGGGRDLVGDFAEALARELKEYGSRWPPGPQIKSVAAGVRQWRDDAIMSGCRMSALPFASGTVIVTDEPRLRASPGGRTVRIHAVSSSRELWDFLEPWEGRLQGAAVAGESVLALADDLRALGITRLAAPGELQDPDMSTWHNGGLAPLEAFGNGPAKAVSSTLRQTPGRSEEP